MAVLLPQFFDLLDVIAVPDHLAELLAYRDQLHEDSHTLRQAIETATRQVDRWLQANTSDLIEGPVGAAVADLLSDAEDQHQQLGDFAPTFDPGHLGTAGQRQVYSDSRDGATTMKTVQRGWLHSSASGPSLGFAEVKVSVDLRKAANDLDVMILSVEVVSA